MRHVALIVIVLMLLANCVSTSTKGVPLDETAIKQIQIGRTNKTEILKMFGAPNRIIDTVGSGTSKPQVSREVNRATKEEVSLGKKQEIYIYEYLESKTNMVTLGESEKKNTLMIWIDKDTEIVQDYGYKGEIK
jgi:hypothetical protein